MPRNSVTIGISHEQPELMARAREKAKRQHRSFSAYVVSLIEKDLEAASSTPDRAAEVLTPRPGRWPSPSPRKE